jgi:hypothetical protein
MSLQSGIRYPVVVRFENQAGGFKAHWRSADIWGCVKHACKLLVQGGGERGNDLYPVDQRIELVTTRYHMWKPTDAL